MKGAHTSHGLSKTRFWSIFINMQTRCNNAKTRNYHLYGGKGVRVLWEKFEDYRDDMYASFLEHVAKHGEKNTTIDRIDVNGNYCKENCRWATYKEQGRNTTQNRPLEFDGKSQTIGAWSEDFGISVSQIRKRLSWGWSIKEAITTKKYAGGKRR